MNKIKIKRVSHFLKQYFVFSKTERKGIYALLVLIVVALFVPKLFRYINPPQPIDFTMAVLASGSNITQTNFNAENNNFTPIDIDSVVLFDFDPNTADSVTLVSLGFSKRVAHSMLNYRLKGGKYRKPEDLYRIYNIDSNHISKLLPYVQIDNVENKANYQTKQYAAKTPMAPVELNTADSLTLVKLYGIGPKMASKIVDYRNRVGGFFRVEQLTEIWGIDEFLLEELAGKIYVDVNKVRYLNINTISYEELKLNPYLRFKTASAIINYRKHHGAFTKVEDLKKVVILPDSTYQKLLPYLTLQ
ncbi:MAG: helix-hairpin-helix domain-containing protein [Bacteroidia bacterium]|nr:helix-hairpin-helix domain-containing protein [Bacteroidia bacterium]